ncbi:hypothetical protein ACJX0J_025188, partial [Zea mays]
DEEAHVEEKTVTIAQAQREKILHPGMLPVFYVVWIPMLLPVYSHAVALVLESEWRLFVDGFESRRRYGHEIGPPFTVIDHLLPTLVAYDHRSYFYDDIEQLFLFIFTTHVMTLYGYSRSSWLSLAFRTIALTAIGPNNCARNLYINMHWKQMKRR